MFETKPAEVPRPAMDRRRDALRREIVDAAWRLCRQHGLTGLSLRDLAAQVGLRAPSLYSYFPSKDAIYDAMFADGQAQLAAALEGLPDAGLSRSYAHEGARRFFDFCTDDPTRHQLMFQRTVPGFVPSPESYALALDIFDRMRRQLRAIGVRSERHLDLWTALITGLVDQQLANEPGGTRWRRLLAEAVDMFLDHAGVPPESEGPTTRRRR
jgi:AcrR family transcriptional regulator